MAQALTSEMPGDLELYGGYTLRLTAISVATGNVINGIQVASLAMYVNSGVGTVVSDLGYGPYLLVPGPGA